MKLGELISIVKSVKGTKFDWMTIKNGRICLGLKTKTVYLFPKAEVDIEENITVPNIQNLIKFFNNKRLLDEELVVTKRKVKIGNKGSFPLMKFIDVPSPDGYEEVGSLEIPNSKFEFLNIKSNGAIEMEMRTHKYKAVIGNHLCGEPRTLLYDKVLEYVASGEYILGQLPEYTVLDSKDKIYLCTFILNDEDYVSEDELGDS